MLTVEFGVTEMKTTLALVLSLSCLCVCACSAPDNTPHADAASSSSSSPVSDGTAHLKLPLTADSAAKLPTATIGDPIRVGDTKLIVFLAGSTKVLGPTYDRQRASSGGMLVVVETAVKNVGNAPISASNLPQIKLMDGNGVFYNEDMGKTAAFKDGSPIIDRKLASDLNPDIAIADGAVFEVSKARFDPKTWFIVASSGELIALRRGPNFKQTAKTLSDLAWDATGLSHATIDITK